uniref:hypothetical protein n=1 Tax=Lactococcus garvieae TaxID=1363 RepID=UPI00359C1A09
MTESEIIEYIIKDIESLGYETIVLPLDRPYTNGKRKIVTYPLPITPFKMAHEFIHAKYKDMCRKSPCDTTSPHEKRANKEAILFLWELFEKNEGASEDISQFINLTDCPEKLSKILVLQSKIKDWSREEISFQVNNYLNKTDEEPENWNLYRIMNACNIDYKWEQLVNKIIKEYYFSHFQSGRVG